MTASAKYSGLRELPDRVTVRIEVSLGSFIKRRADGGIDMISPLPSPFNYGEVPDIVAADGEGLDAIVLGPRLPPAHTAAFRVHGWVRFVDAGLQDPKLLCGDHPPTPRQLRRLRQFFWLYARAKSVIGGCLGRRASTFDGIVLR